MLRINVLVNNLTVTFAMGIGLPDSLWYCLRTETVEDKESRDRAEESYMTCFSSLTTYREKDDTGLRVVHHLSGYFPFFNQQGLQLSDMEHIMCNIGK